MSLDADDLLGKALEALNIDLPALIAATSIWASPKVVLSLRSLHGHAAYSPKMRRFKRTVGEVRRQTLPDGTRLDDNTEANRVAKLAMGLTRRAKGFAVCHIWPDTCYDVRYHTSLANLVLLPRSLEALSDHNKAVIAALQYRAYSLYDWHPEESQKPRRPKDYPAYWRPPEPPPAHLLESINKKLADAAGLVPHRVNAGF